MSIIYRPEIDGLRTVAVMLVIFHHLGWSFLPGGYIGVDVFFVISGYLITKIVANEIRNGRFSIGNFYKRRVLRLAPAYFLVLVVTSIVSAIVMLPAELVNYFKSVVWSTSFAANIYMWKEVGGYFGVSSEAVPLLHLWSLAVEEQFYIFWPIILFLIIKFIPKKFIAALLLLSVFLGVGISEWGVNNYRAGSYYLMPTRAFELLMGAFLVFLPERKWSLQIRSIMSIAGLAFIFYSAITYSTKILFPGVNAILPCLGTALVLVFCQSKSDIAGRFLSTSPMTLMGKISYPAYLWHWPIIAFLNLYMIEINFLIGVLVMTVTVVLSSLTYLYCENPAKRFNRYTVKKIVGYGFLAPALSFLFVTNYVNLKHGWPQRFPESMNLKSEALQSLSHKIRLRCIEGNSANPFPENECILGNKNRPVDFLLIGDSHANHFTGMLDVMAKDAGIRGYEITQIATIYLPDLGIDYEIDGKKFEYKNFEVRNNFLKNLISKKRYKAVILAGSYTQNYKEGGGKYFSKIDPGFSNDIFERQFEQAIIKIKNSGARIFLIKGNPILDGVNYDCSLSNERFNIKKNCSFDIKIHQKQFKKWSHFVDILFVKYPDLVIIDPAKIMCNEISCFSEINGIPLYRDGNHLNHIGSELIGSLYIEKFGNPLSIISDKKLTGR
jgi:peptidoglycan/LPS O-acetylase OafA/YrhL